MLDPFQSENIYVGTSTTSSQTAVFPASDGTTTQIVVRNAAANPIYVAKGATVAIPGATPSAATAEVIEVGPSTIQTFTLELVNGGSISFIAATAGGAITIMTGTGF